MKPIHPGYIKRKVTGFGANWASLLWRVMSITGKGFRKPSLKWSPGDTRRPDKRDGTPKRFRQYKRRYA